jgi:hypothetical protein
LVLLTNKNIRKVTKKHTEEVRRISSKRLEVARGRLGPQDEVQRSYAGRLDDRRGMLMASNEKLLFVEEKGFLSKTYDVVLDLPYGEVRECVPVDRYKMRISCFDGRQHEFVSEIAASLVDEPLKELMEAARKKEPEEAERETTAQLEG